MPYRNVIYRFLSGTLPNFTHERHQRDMCYVAASPWQEAESGVSRQFLHRRPFRQRHLELLFLIAT
jgi:hypothetical protein